MSVDVDQIVEHATNFDKVYIAPKDFIIHCWNEDMILDYLVAKTATTPNLMTVILFNANKRQYFSFIERKLYALKVKYTTALDACSHRFNFKNNASLLLMDDSFPVGYFNGLSVSLLYIHNSVYIVNKALEIIPYMATNGRIIHNS